MKTVDKLMLKSFLGPMVVAFFIVMFVLLMNFMWKYIDELVGKGLDFGVILELMGHALIATIPMGLPLATLFGAIMTMGNLGENYELLALKSAGMSLMRILRPLMVVVALVAIASFFIANNLVPYSTKQMSALIYDIKEQKQTIDFQDGIFFTGLDDMTIRVDRQVGEEKLLKGVLIYDNSRNGVMGTTLADSGYVKLSDDKRHLMVTLYNGVNYETNRVSYRSEWYNDSKMTRNFFEQQYIVNSLSGYDFSRTDTDLFSRGNTKTIGELQGDIDSLKTVVNRNVAAASEPLFNEFIFQHDKTLMVDSLRATSPHIYPSMVMDSLATLDVREKQKVWKNALMSAQNSRSRSTWDENQLKNSLNSLYTHQISWHEKVSLPFSIMIFFLIGAALGAIIRKGGLGMPVVVSVLFFVFYYVINIFATKMAKEGTITAFQGTWAATFILLPIGLFLIYKATNDSNLFNAEWYIYRYRDIKNFVKRIIKKQDNDTIQQRA